eukprot:6183892-Pleurochrysis_carterae.AAC.1
MIFDEYAINVLTASLQSDATLQSTTAPQPNEELCCKAQRTTSVQIVRKPSQLKVRRADVPTADFDGDSLLRLFSLHLRHHLPPVDCGDAES